MGKARMGKARKTGKASDRQSSEVYVFKVNQRDFPEIPDATEAEISQFQASSLYQNQTFLYQKQLQEKFWS